MKTIENEKGFDLYGILNGFGERCSCGKHHTTSIKKLSFNREYWLRFRI